MSVSLRKIKLKGGRLSLYIDFYPALRHPDTGKFTRREFLKLYLYEKPKSELERSHNKQTLMLAEHVTAKRLIEVQNKRFGFLSEARKDGKVLDFFKRRPGRKEVLIIGIGKWPTGILKIMPERTFVFGILLKIFVMSIETTCFPVLVLGDLKEASVQIQL